MKITLLDFHCLNSVIDDYENLPLIIKELNETLHKRFSEDEICKCLARLIEVELLAIFEYDSNTYNYVGSDLADGNCSEKWFFITNKGRKILDKHSNDFLTSE